MKSKLAGARTPVGDLTLDELRELLNAGLSKRAELQPPFVPPKDLKEAVRTLVHGDVSIPLDTNRSFASIRSIMRYLLIDGTTAIKESPQVAGMDLIGWEAMVVKDPDDVLVLKIRGWFRHV